MDWSLAGAVILSGLVIVFLVLIILIAVVYAAGGVIKSNGGQSTPEAAVPAGGNAAAVPDRQKPAPTVESGVSEETVAVISAAVAAVVAEQSPGVSYAVTNIRRARAARPVWGFAGMQQNTRPF